MLGPNFKLLYTLFTSLADQGLIAFPFACTWRKGPFLQIRLQFMLGPDVATKIMCRHAISTLYDRLHTNQTSCQSQTRC